VVGTSSKIGKRLSTALNYTGRTESTLLLEEAATFDAELMQ